MFSVSLRPCVVVAGGGNMLNVGCLKTKIKAGVDTFSQLSAATVWRVLPRKMISEEVTDKSETHAKKLCAGFSGWVHFL